MESELEQCFWQKVDKTPGHGPNGDCWLWTGAKSGRLGYGVFRTFRAHRAAFMLTKGDIPEGLMLLHSCDNPPCVNPSHLRPGTALQNKRDAIKKKRHSFGEKHGRAVLTNELVLEIRRLRATGLSGLKIAALLKVNYRAVYRVVKKEFWKHVS